MYTRQEASQIRKKFWTRFGQYMRPIAGANGDTINWLNYKTGIRHLYFRMDADKEAASIAIELRHADEGVRNQLYAQLLQLKTILEETIGEPWGWQQNVTDEDGNTISRIYKTLPGVNIFNEADWPVIISFLKPGIIALDVFWDKVKDGF